MTQNVSQSKHRKIPDTQKIKNLTKKKTKKKKKKKEKKEEKMVEMQRLGPDH